MLLIQDALRIHQIILSSVSFIQGKPESNQIMARHSVLSGSRRHLLQRSSSWVANLLGLDRQRGLLDLLAQHSDSLALGSDSPSPRWMARICSAQEKISLGFEIEVATSVWIFELRVSTSCSRLSIGNSRVRRSLTDWFQQFFAAPTLQVQIDRDSDRRSARGLRCSARGDFYLLGQRGEPDDFLKLALGVAHHIRSTPPSPGDIFDQLEFRAKVRSVPVYSRYERAKPSTSTRTVLSGN